MSERELKIVRAIVSGGVGQPDDYTRLRPIQKAYWGTQYPKWEYNPDPDIVDTISIHTDEQMESAISLTYERFPHTGIQLEIMNNKELMNQVRNDISNPKKINYADYKNISEMKKEIEYWRVITETYNTFVREEQAWSGKDLVAKVPVDKDGNITSGDVKEAWADMPKQYRQAYVPDLWDVEIQVTPSGKIFESNLNPDAYIDFLGIYSFQDEAIYLALRELESSARLDEFIMMFNLMLYDHIQEMRKIADKGGAWNKDNNYWLPNMAFIHYFQKEGIDPQNAERFHNCTTEIRMPVSIGALASDGTSYIRDIFRDIEYSEVNTYSEKTYSKIFGGHQEFNDDSVTLKDLAWKCRKIYGEYPYHFDTLRKCYWEACSWWKLFGVKDTKQSKNRPKDGKIHWMQLEKAVHK